MVIDFILVWCTFVCPVSEFYVLLMSGVRKEMPDLIFVPGRVRHGWIVYSLKTGRIWSGLGIALQLLQTERDLDREWV